MSIDERGKSGFRGFLKTKLGIAMVAVLGVLIAVSAVVAISAAMSSSTPVAGPAGTTAPVDVTEPEPVESEDPTATSPAADFTEADLTIEGLGIPAGLSAEEFGKALVERNFVPWNPLKTDAYSSEIIAEFGNGVPVIDTVSKKADELSAIQTESTFNSDALQNPRVQQFIENKRLLIIAALQGWFLTYESGNPEDIEPYDRGYELIGATEVSLNENGGRDLEVTVQEYDNRDLNRMGTQYENSIGIAPENPVTFKISTVVENGVEKISDIETVLAG